MLSRDRRRALRVCEATKSVEVMPGICAESLAHLAPNNRLQPTPYNLRYAAASGRDCGAAISGVRRSDRRMALA